MLCHWKALVFIVAAACATAAAMRSFMLMSEKPSFLSGGKQQLYLPNLPHRCTIQNLHVWSAVNCIASLHGNHAVFADYRDPRHHYQQALAQLPH